MNEKRIEAAVAGLSRYNRAKSERLSYGLKLRNALARQIENNQTPSGYRVDWLDNSSTALVGFLSDLALDFNLRHMNSGDSCSSQDLVDVLQTTLNRFKRIAGKG